ncbi:MAG: hypothetical protein V1834_00185 [Candidatus Micrarchaeota archaeon]
MKKINLVLLALAALFLVWYFAFGGDQQTGKAVTQVTAPESNFPERMQAFESEEGDYFLNYFDKENDFGVKYPEGYPVQLANDSAAYLKLGFFASRDYFEIIYLDFITDDFSLQDFVEASASDTQFQGLQEVQVKGRKVLLADVKGNVFDFVPFIGKAGVIECARSDKSIAVLGVLPENLIYDLNVVEYMIYSVDC